MLWQRVVTALLLIPLVIGGVLLLDSTALALLLGGLVMLGGFEMARLANLRRPRALLGFGLLLGVALWLAWRYLGPPLVVSVQWVMAVWWVVTTVLLVLRRSALQPVERPRPVVLAVGGLVLVVAWLSVVHLHASGPRGPLLVVFLFVLIWVADSGAYFAGRAFGRTKLSPFVSPGKTWAGAFGAFAGAVVSGLALALSGAAGAVPLASLVLLCVLVTAVSIGGDLWESRLKREAGVKDSGTLLPGHGGVLDRIDSLLAAAPVFSLGAVLIGATV